jgi:hypothetical protein
VSCKTYVQDGGQHGKSELKHFFGILVNDGFLDPQRNLPETDWEVLYEIQKVLEPFMLVRRILEGQKYVTLPFVAYVINNFRKNVVHMMNTARSSEVRELCKQMLEHPVSGVNVYWGSGEPNTMFDENNSTGRGNRQKGFPQNTLH